METKVIKHGKGRFTVIRQPTQPGQGRKVVAMDVTVAEAKQALAAEIASEDSQGVLPLRVPTRTGG